MDAFEKWWAEQMDSKIVANAPLAKEAFRAGMRAAAAMCNAADKSTHPADLADAILKEAGE